MRMLDRHVRVRERRGMTSRRSAKLQEADANKDHSACMSVNPARKTPGTHMQGARSDVSLSSAQSPCLQVA
eukprot:8909847-Heterocapsa_arctica.AAC.1